MATIAACEADMCIANFLYAVSNTYGKKWQDLSTAAHGEQPLNSGKPWPFFDQCNKTWYFCMTSRQRPTV